MKLQPEEKQTLRIEQTESRVYGDRRDLAKDHSNVD